MKHKFAVGMKVSYRPNFGTAPPIVVTIIEADENKGRPCYSFNNGHWAYESQVDKEVT